MAIDKEALSSFFAECQKIASERNAIYGDESLKKFSETGMLIRAFDKLERIRHLIGNKGISGGDERLKDSCIDAANYLAYIALSWEGMLYEDTEL